MGHVKKLNPNIKKGNGKTGKIVNRLSVFYQLLKFNKTNCNLL